MQQPDEASPPSLAAARGRGGVEPDLAAAWKEPGLAQACWVAPADLTLVLCAASPEYWLLFAVLGAGGGCGLLFSNNLGARHPKIQKSQTC